MGIREIREELVATARQMLADGLVTFTAGNLSLRIPGEEAIAITPTSRPYNTMEPEDVPIVTLDGRVVDGQLKPSSETPMHTMIFRHRPDVNAVVHTHSPHALAFAVAHEPIPLLCIEGLATRAMSVLVAEFGLPGTEEIGQRALEALDRQPGSQAVLLANHGLLTIGKSLEEAYSIASKVETEAMVYHLALGVGRPVPLTEEQVCRIRHRYEAKKEG